MLCPNCLQNVPEFQERRQYNSLTLACPQCKEPVPVRYRDEYDQYPPIVFSVVGRRGHGKTVFFSSLLLEFERLTKRSKTFSYTPLDEAGLAPVREAQRALEEGHLPQATPANIFPKPAILQIEGLEDSRDFRLLVYDIGGDTFDRVAEIEQYGGYVSRGRSTIWLISLPVLQERESPRDLEDFVIKYEQAVRQLRGRAKDQTLLIVLTMGDELLKQNDVPPMTQNFLRGDYLVGDHADITFLEGLSREIESWLENKSGYQNFARRVRKEFADVRYCAISALGSAPQGQMQLVNVVPRGVLVPLQWVLHFERGRQNLQQRLLAIATTFSKHSAMIETYLDKATSTRLEDGLREAKQTAETGSTEQALQRARAIATELAQSIRRARLKRFARYVTFILIGCVVMTGLAWAGWRLWLFGQRKENWYVREHIAEMLADGGVLEIPPGEYELSKLVVLHKPLSLKGSGKDHTRIICKEGTSGLMYAAEGVFAAADITFQYSGTAPANVLTVESGQVDFQRCRFTGGKRDQTSRPVGNGVQLKGHTTGTISDCEFVANALHGLSVNDQAQPTLTGDVMQQNQGAGIAYSGFSAGTAQNTSCYQNQSHGVQVSEQARPALEAGVCNNNQRSGISFSGTSAGAARNYQCIENRMNGITVEGQGQPALEGDVCQTNQGAGIAYADNSSGIAQKNQCLKNNQAGISVNKRAQPALEANACRNNSHAGILYLGESAGTATKNECSNNRMSGISVEGQAQPVLDGNTCKDNQNCGIRYIGGAGGTARNNTAAANRADGILVRDRSQPVLEGNLCQSNQGSGIAYYGKAAGLARNNKCIGNRLIGLAVSDEAQPTLEENESSGNESTDYKDWRTPDPTGERPSAFLLRRRSQRYIVRLVTFDA